MFKTPLRQNILIRFRIRNVCSDKQKKKRKQIYEYSKKFSYNHVLLKSNK
jgi:hypothetical protein